MRNKNICLSFFILYFISYFCTHISILSVKIREVIDALECFAPLPLQESYDNAGLQVGLTEAEVSGVLLCIDVTEKVVDEAAALGCNLIVSHHPLLFRGLKCISDANYVQRTVMKAIQKGVTVVSMHTNFDNAKNGVNYKIAQKIGLHDVTFLGDEAQKAGHGSGVIGTLDEPMTAREFVSVVKSVLNADDASCNQLLRSKISRVAICGGGGAFLLDDAIKCKADAFITGEMHYHEYFGHEQEIQIVVVGHYESEQFTNEIFRDVIAKANPGIKTYLTKTNTNPIIHL